MNYEAYSEGREAYWDGQRLSSNPYEGIEASEWDDGWFDARDDDVGYDYECDCGCMDD